jgi:serine/threonine protein kinase
VRAGKPVCADRGWTIPLDEALPIARQIAEALEAAHEAGIIHRDLKPANIKVRDDGTVKVLDFGLAKALDTAPNAVADAATITSPALTMHGVILGTAAYMTPEQAKGKPVDRRADIWAFGCVLYEMLRARRAFDGDDSSDVGMIRGAASAGSLADEEPAPAGVCLELLTIPGDSRGLDKGSPHRKKHERGLEATEGPFSDPCRGTRRGLAVVDRRSPPRTRR